MKLSINCEGVSKEYPWPRRVIEVQDWQHSPHFVRLYESHGECSLYFALNHRRGINQLLKTALLLDQTIYGLRVIELKITKEFNYRGAMWNEVSRNPH